MVEEKTGTVDSFTDDHSGYVTDDTMPGTKHEFKHRGAKVEFITNEKVTYLLITTNGVKKAVNLGKPI